MRTLHIILQRSNLYVRLFSANDSNFIASQSTQDFELRIGKNVPDRRYDRQDESILSLPPDDPR